MTGRAVGRRFAPVGAALLALLAAGGGGGCAYFNTLHNARAKFAEAQEIKDRADPERTEITKQEETLYGEAFEKAARVVKYWPDSKWVDDALLLMGEASFEKGDYSTALRKYDEILKFFPDSDVVGETLVQKARTHVETREWAQAETALERAAARDEKEWRDDVLYLRGRVREARGDVEGALESYSGVIDRHGGSPWYADAGTRAGRLAEERGNPEVAVSFFERVRADGRTPEERWYGGMAKGEALLELGEWKRAETTFGDVADRSANADQEAKALSRRGEAIARGGDVERAIREWKELLEKHPRREGSADAQLGIARWTEAGGDLEAAKAEYELVREQGTSHPAWLEASERIARIDRVLELRGRIEGGEESEPERVRFLLAEHYLERLDDPAAALSEYESLAGDAFGTEWGARALYAQGWLHANRFDEPDSADVLWRRLAGYYAGTEVDAWARRRFGRPVWTVEIVEPPRVVFIRPEGDTGEPVDIDRDLVAPREVPLPEGVTRVRVWARLHLADDGSVERVKIVKSGGEEFDAAVEEAALASSFLPPAEGGPSITVREYVFPPEDVAPGQDAPEPSAAQRDAALDAADDADAAQDAPDAPAPPEGPGQPSVQGLPPGVSVPPPPAVPGDSAGALADSTGAAAEPGAGGAGSPDPGQAQELQGKAEGP